MGKKDYTEEGWIKPRWTQGKLQKPQVMLPQAQRQTQDLSKPSWVCSGRLPWQLCPGAESFWPLLSNFLGCQCCISNDIFFMGLFQLCCLMQLSQISLGSCQEKKKKEDFSILKVLCLFSAIRAGHVTHYDQLIDRLNTCSLFTNCSSSCFMLTYLLLGRVYTKHIHDSLWSLDYS